MRSPDQGSLQRCLGGAVPPGPCAQALGRLQSSSASCPLLEFSPSSAIAHVCLAHPFPCPACLPFLQITGWPCPLRLELRRDCYSFDKETQAGIEGRGRRQSPAWGCSHYKGLLLVSREAGRRNVPMSQGQVPVPPPNSSPTNPEPNGKSPTPAKKGYPPTSPASHLMLPPLCAIPSQGPMWGLLPLP